MNCKKTRFDWNSYISEIAYLIEFTQIMSCIVCYNTHGSLMPAGESSNLLVPINYSLLLTQPVYPSKKFGHS